MNNFLKTTLAAITIFVISYGGYVMVWALSGQAPQFNIFADNIIIGWLITSFVIAAIYNLFD